MGRLYIGARLCSQIVIQSGGNKKSQSSPEHLQRRERTLYKKVQWSYICFQDMFLSNMRWLEKHVQSKDRRTKGNKRTMIKHNFVQQHNTGH